MPVTSIEFEKSTTHVYCKEYAMPTVSYKIVKLNLLKECFDEPTSHFFKFQLVIACDSFIFHFQSKGCLFLFVQSYQNIIGALKFVDVIIINCKKN